MLRRVRFLLDEALSAARAVCAGSREASASTVDIDNCVHYQLESRVLMSASLAPVVLDATDGSDAEQGRKLYRVGRTAAVL